MTKTTPKSPLLAFGFFGSITSPYSGKYRSLPAGAGLFLLISNAFKLISVIAGLYFIVQLFMAGYLFMSAENDPKKLQVAQGKIFQAALGLAVIASAFVIAAVASRFTGINILNPTIYGPND